MTKKTKNALAVVLVLAMIMGMIAFAANTVKGITGTGSASASVPDVNVITPSFSLKGKTVSFLGDSITTYAGWSDNPKDNSTLVKNYTKYNSSIMNVNSTWWKQTINELQLSLCVNNSCDASRVTDTNYGTPNGMNRAMQLHRDNGTKPDIIIVYLGTNDLGNDIPLNNDTDEVIDRFIPAYSIMLDNIKATYPNADVFVCTLLPEGRNDEDELLEYNEAIREIANDQGVNVIDLYADSGITRANYLQYVLDEGTLKVHPNEEGMDKISDTVVKALTEYYR